MGDVIPSRLGLLYSYFVVTRKDSFINVVEYMHEARVKKDENSSHPLANDHNPLSTTERPALQLPRSSGFVEQRWTRTTRAFESRSTGSNRSKSRRNQFHSTAVGSQITRLRVSRRCR